MTDQCVESKININKYKVIYRLHNQQKEESGGILD